MKLPVLVGMMVSFLGGAVASASDYVAPKKSSDKVVVIDAYEKNPIDWENLKKNKNLGAFIGKASDGLASPWACPNGDEAKRALCKKSFQNYHLKKELYHTRKMMAKAMGLKWGSYHLGRPGNPIEQAYHYLQFANPQPDELIALDIEHDDPEKWISFADAERFARYIHARIGRYPVLYTNHDTARRIAAQRDKYPLLSRLPLWYARFKGDIRGVFPMGNWESYALWQFSARPNCNSRRCLYRISGTQTDIDVNATGMTAEEFDAAWPFDGLVPERLEFKPAEILVASADIGNSENPFEYLDVVRGKKKSAVKKTRSRHKRNIRRYAVNYTFEDDDGQMVKLATIAAPTPTPLEKKPVIEVKSNVALASASASAQELPQEIAKKIPEKQITDFTVTAGVTAAKAQEKAARKASGSDAKTSVSRVANDIVIKKRKFRTYGYVLQSKTKVKPSHLNERYQR